MQDGKYKLIGATALSFVICQMDKARGGPCCCAGWLAGRLAVASQLLRRAARRRRPAGLTQRALCLCNACSPACSLAQVNISVAIIPMAQEFGWSPTVAGLVQSSFFWGYIISQASCTVHALHVPTCTVCVCSL